MRMWLEGEHGGMGLKLYLHSSLFGFFKLRMYVTWGVVV